MASLDIDEDDIECGPRETFSDVISEQNYHDNEILQLVGSSNSGDGTNFASNLPTCLALNQAYQEFIAEKIENLEQLLDENLERQNFLSDESDSQSKHLPKGSICNFSCFCPPYFKDNDGNIPPINEDQKQKMRLRQLDPYIMQPKPWSHLERKKLHKSISNSIIDRVYDSLESREEYLTSRTESSTLDAVEKENSLSKLSKVRTDKAEFADKTHILPSEFEKYANYIDWLKISAKDFQGTRDSDDLRLMWKNFLSPSISKKAWESSEDQKLEQLAMKLRYQSWADVGVDLDSARTAFQCIERYFTKLDPVTRVGKWTPEEDNFLRTIVNRCKIGEFIPWYHVAYFFEHRVLTMVRKRYMTALHPNYRHGPWTSSEDKALLYAAKCYGSDWKKVSKYVGTRNNVQCRDRYRDSLCENIRFDEWTPEDDGKLVEAVKIHGTDRWSEVCKVMPGRTNGQVRQRYKCLTRSTMKLDRLKSVAERYTIKNRCNVKFKERNQILAEDAEKRIRSLAAVTAGYRETGDAVSSDRETNDETPPEFVDYDKLFRRMAKMKTRIPGRLRTNFRRIDESGMKANELIDGLILPMTHHMKFRNVRARGRHSVMEEERINDNVPKALKSCMGNRFEDHSDVPIFAPNHCTINGFKLILLTRPTCLRRLSSCSDEALKLIEFLGGGKLPNLRFGDAYTDIDNDSILSPPNDESDGDRHVEPDNEQQSLAHNNRVQRNFSKTFDLFSDECSVSEISDELEKSVSRASSEQFQHDWEDNTVELPPPVLGIVSDNFISCFKPHLNHRSYSRVITESTVSVPDSDDDKRNPEILKEFKLLESRFMSLFSWPCLLSNTPPSEESSVKNAAKTSKKKKQLSNYRKKPMKRPWITEMFNKKRGEKITEDTESHASVENTERAKERHELSGNRKKKYKKRNWSEILPERHSSKRQRKKLE